MLHDYHFHLHGDNIVECERTVTLLRESLKSLTKQVRGPYGIATCPSYELKLVTNNSMFLTLYPGFGRWNEDVLGVVRKRGGTLREAADVIVCRIEGQKEVPLLAMEYCGALPAGNQAWQRSGRAHSFGKAKIPYLYIAELGGFELGPDRTRRSPRLPNPAVPFSFVGYSLKNETPTMPVFVPSPGADDQSRQEYEGVFGEEDLLKLLRTVVAGDSYKASLEALRSKALLFVEKRALNSRGGKTLTPAQWGLAYEALQAGQPLVDFLVSGPHLKWAKTAYIDGLTSTAKSLMAKASEVAIGLTSSDLPMCVVPATSRLVFANFAIEIFKGRLSPHFVNWLKEPRHLSICWVMGFKPKGDDARPDRGLPPLTRMLIGEGQDLLTVVYGPASAETWTTLDSGPRTLLKNGLWESILSVSDAILVDSSTDTKRKHGYIRSHWHEEPPAPSLEPFYVEPSPVRIGENDVDTVIHLLLASHGGASIFEGMCNPPGGDWSGVSLLSADRGTEFRWVTLPRVSAVGGKRPDHVFQIFRDARQPIVLAIESKEKVSDVEIGIGERLTTYISDLVRSSPSIERTRTHSTWKHAIRESDSSHYLFASAVAFLADDIEGIERAKRRAKADLLISCAFQLGGKTCLVRLMPITEMGISVANIIDEISAKRNGITTEIES